MKKSRIPRRSGETQTNTMKSLKTKNVSPTNYSRNNIRQSTSFGNLTDEQSMNLLYRTIDQRNGQLVKRTKSFWKFGKSDDEILEGMALWQHKDLVQTDFEKTMELERESATLKRIRNRSLENQTISTNSSETLVENGQHDRLINDFSSIDEASMHYPMPNQNDIDVRATMQRSDENLYGTNEDVNMNINMKMHAQPSNMVSRAKLVRQNYIEMEMDNNKTETYKKSSSKKEKQQQQQQKQQQTQQRSRSNKSNQKNANGKSNQVIKTIEYYDTSDMDTLKKQSNRKSDYKNRNDFDEPPLIINTNSLHRSAAENQFFDDDSVTDVIMKTVKRQEILKQYYSSGTDTERNSASSSDPYDCIVVDDHLVRRENAKNKTKSGATNGKMEFKTFRGNAEQNIELDELNTSRPGTLLPRTKLAKNVPSAAQRSNGCFSDTDAIMKSKHMDRRERRPERKQNAVASKSNKTERRTEYQNIDGSKSYGPWYDLWGQDGSVRQMS